MEFNSEFVYPYYSFAMMFFTLIPYWFMFLNCLPRLNMNFFNRIRKIIFIGNITIRIDKALKNSLDTLFKNLGTTTNSVINMFLKHCEREQSLLFTLSLDTTSSKELAESMQEIDNYNKFNFLVLILL